MCDMKIYYINKYNLLDSNRRLWDDGRMKIEIRFRYSARGRNGFLVYVDGKFHKSFRTKVEAEAEVKRLHALIGENNDETRNIFEDNETRMVCAWRISQYA